MHLINIFDFYPVRKCLDSERARSSNLENALKHERLNVVSRESELEKKSLLIKELSNREQETVKDLEQNILLGMLNQVFDNIIWLSVFLITLISYFLLLYSIK